MKRLLFIASALLAGSAAASFELVGPERTARVVLAKDAEPSSVLAAQELTNYVFRMTGRLLPVARQGSSDDSPAVLIGTLDRFPGKVPDEVRTKLSGMRQTEAAYTGVRGKSLCFVGREEVAELYAVYHFLEKELGIRWFQAPVPEDPGDYVPLAERVELADFERYREPWFSERRLDLTGAAATPTPAKGMSTAVRNGFQVPPPYGGKGDAFYRARLAKRRFSLGGGHGTFCAVMPGKKCFKEHPEWFPLIDGQRKCLDNDYMNMYCMSNPEVRDNVANALLKRLDETGGKGFYHFGQVDTPHGACQCPDCLALDSPRERADKTHRSGSTRYVKTANAICDKVFAKYPNAEISMWAYLTYRELPEGAKPDPRMMLWWCPHGRCYGHGLDDPNCDWNRPFFAQLQSWLKLLPRAFTYDYLTCSHQVYDCSECVEPHDIRLYRDLGMIGWKNEAAFSDANFVGGTPASRLARRENFPSNWQWLYLTGHMLWDPDLDDRAFVADAERLYYGAAYPAMAKYHALRRKLWSSCKEHFGYPYGNPRRPTLLNEPGAKEKLLGCLDEAERLVEGVEKRCRCRKDGKNSTLHLDSTPTPSVLRHRLARDRKWLTEYWIKPNEELKELAKKVMTVPRTAKAVTIDGKGDDSAWTEACRFDDFRALFGKDARKPSPADRAAELRMTYDNDNLYFLMTAKEPLMEKLVASVEKGAEVWGEDSFEVFLFPPSAENAVYHVAVNPRGNLWAHVKPGGKVADAFGAEAKGELRKDGYTIELKVPLARISPAKPGDTWRLHVGYNRVGKLPDGTGAEHYAIDGTPFSDTLHFRPLRFGAK